MKQEIIQRLHELSESITERHGWTVLKSHIEAIDEVISAGVKAKAIEDALAKLGLDLAPSSLRSALYRYRRKRKAQGINGKPSSNVADPVPHRSSLSEAEKEFVSSLTPLEQIEFYGTGLKRGNAWRIPSRDPLGLFCPLAALVGL